jgi:hypothetical protein
LSYFTIRTPIRKLDRPFAAVLHSRGRLRCVPQTLDFDTEIRRVGRETVAAIAAIEPDVPIERRIVTLAELARETREPEPYRRGVVVAVISWLSRSGSLQVVGITLGWDGVVRHSRLPWER